MVLLEIALQIDREDVKHLGKEGVPKELQVLIVERVQEWINGAMKQWRLNKFYGQICSFQVT